MDKNKALSDDLDKFLDPALDGIESVPDLEPSLASSLPRGYLSVSQASTFLNCERMWELRYIEGKTSKTSYRPFEGRNVHYAVEDMLSDKKDFGKLETFAKAADAFSTAFEETRNHVEDWEGLDSGVAKDRGIALTKIFYDNAAPMAAPIAVEERFTVNIDIEDGRKLPILGIVDSIQIQAPNADEPYDPAEMLVSKLPRRIHDLKVVTDKWGPNDMMNDLQFHTYAQVLGIPDTQVDMVVKGRAAVPRPRYETDQYVVTQKDGKHALKVLQGVAESIARGTTNHFKMTNPGNWWCSEKWCSMWGHCRGAK